MKESLKKSGIQAAMLFGLAWLVYLGARLFGASTENLWLIATSSLLFFAIANPILSIFRDRHFVYALSSIGWMLLATLSFLIAGKMGLADSWKLHPAIQQMIGVALLIHILLLVIARLLKGIYTFTMLDEGQGDYFQ